MEQLREKFLNNLTEEIIDCEFPLFTKEMAELIAVIAYNHALILMKDHVNTIYNDSLHYHDTTKLPL